VPHPRASILLQSDPEVCASALALPKKHNGISTATPAPRIVSSTKPM
jgi:hypothetical protein